MFNQIWDFLKYDMCTYFGTRASIYILLTPNMWITIYTNFNQINNREKYYPEMPYMQCMFTKKKLERARRIIHPSVLIFICFFYLATKLLLKWHWWYGSTALTRSDHRNFYTSPL
jgi:hypothetical protein